MSGPRILGPDGVSQLATPKPETAEGFEFSTDFNPVTGRGTVKFRIPGTTDAYQMLPAEARILGMRLIVESENAITNAIFLRAAIELFQVPLVEAVQMLRAIGSATRADHAMVYEHMLKEMQRQKAMAQETPEDDNGQSRPN